MATKDKNDGSLSDDGIIMEADKVEQDETEAPAKKKSKSKLYFLLGSAAVIVFVIYGMAGSDSQVTTMPVATPPTMNTTAGGVNVSDNPAFLEDLRRSNDVNAEEARLRGETYIPMSENALRPNEMASESIPEAVTPEVAPAPERAPVEIARISPPPTMPQLRREEPAPTQATQSLQSQQGSSGQQQQQQQENPYVAAMGQYFGKVSQVRSSRESQEGTVSSTRTGPAQVASAGSPVAAPPAQAGGGLYAGQAPRASSEGVVNPQQMPVVSPTSGSRGVMVSSDGYARDASGNVIGYTDQDGVVRGPDGGAIGTVGQDGALIPLPGATQSAVAGTQESSPAVAETKSDEVYIPAGDIIYAEVLANASSDRPEVPIIATVTVGEYEGARVIGTFSVDDQSGKMVISFSQMTLGDETVPVRALAVDGFSGDNAVRSGIERRYVKRYAPVFASAFLNGVAKGLSETDQAIVGVGDSQTVVTTAKTVEESVWSGIADATGTITQDISSRAPKGPNIKIGAGYPIGIMFVEDLRENPEGEK